MDEEREVVLRTIGLHQDGLTVCYRRLLDIEKEMNTPMVTMEQLAIDAITELAKAVALLQDSLHMSRQLQHREMTRINERLAALEAAVMPKPIGWKDYEPEYDDDDNGEGTEEADETVEAGAGDPGDRPSDNEAPDSDPGIGYIKGDLA